MKSPQRIASIFLALFLSIPCLTYAQNTTYKVQPKDTFYLLSQKYNISFSELLGANNANSNTLLYVGQNIILPLNNQTIHTVKSGESYWAISKLYGVNFFKLLEYNGANSNSYSYTGQKIRIPVEQIEQVNTTSSKPYITYSYYTVKNSDTFWGISEKFSLPMNELLKTNNLTEYSAIWQGMVIKIPIHHIPVKATPSSKYGEFLDWWTEAQYVIPLQSTFEVVDFYTGKSFWAKRTIGATHADCEPLSLRETNKMKAIWGGYFTWTSRPVIVKYNGRKIAASASAMPHAGNDYTKGGAWTNWRSGGYGSGPNFDWINNNGAHGHFDIHFLNSTRHKDGRLDTKHQKNVKISSGTN